VALQPWGIALVGIGWCLKRPRTNMGLASLLHSLVLGCTILGSPTYFMVPTTGEMQRTRDLVSYRCRNDFRLFSVVACSKKHELESRLFGYTGAAEHPGQTAPHRSSPSIMLLAG
jgi:hypothetical protein